MDISASTMKVTAREIKTTSDKSSKLYCIQDGKNYVFALSNYSWSLEVKNSRQLEERMKYEGGMFGRESLKTAIVVEMKEMMKELSPIKSIELER